MVPGPSFREGCFTTSAGFLTERLDFAEMVGPSCGDNSCLPLLISFKLFCVCVDVFEGDCLLLFF